MKRFVCIDVETTGLNPITDQILEVGAVIADLEGNILNHFQCILKHKRIQGSAFALAMNSDILREIFSSGRAVTLDDFRTHFQKWLLDNFEEEKITLAGKNYGGFDHQFLINAGVFPYPKLNLSHRYLDPGTLWFDPEQDDALPDLKICTQRAGVPFCKQHRALDDATVTAQVISAYYRRKS